MVIIYDTVKKKYIVEYIITNINVTLTKLHQTDSMSLVMIYSTALTVREGYERNGG